MRLLFVLPEYPPDHSGGIATHYEALLPALVRLGHSVDVLVGSAFESGRAASERDGVMVRGLEADRADRLLPAYGRYEGAPEFQRHLAAARALWEQADGGAGYDAVEVVDWGLIFAPWVGGEGPPAAVQLHGSTGQIALHDPLPGHELAGQLARLVEAGLLPHAPALHTSSTANAADWAGVTGRTVGVTPPPLPPRAVTAPAARSRSAFVAARLQEWKGPHVLCEALRETGPGGPTVEWAGRAVAHPRTGEPYDAVLARDFPDVWGTRLRPLGTLRPGDVARKQAAAAFVVVPSLWDVYNLTVAEAMQQGAVVVCSRGAGGVDLVEDGVTGLAFDAGDAASLAACLSRAAGLGSAEAATMGRAAQAAVRRATDPDAVARQKVAQFEAAQSAPRRAAPSPWLVDAVAPGAGVAAMGFLDHLPLRSLATYAARRAVKKGLARGR